MVFVPKDLREEVIPILQAELIRRGKKGDADTLANFKEEDSNLLYQNMSLNQLREMVEERLNAGEEMDSIKIDLRLNGIDVFEVLKEEVKLQEEVFDSITKLKETGASSDDIDNHLEPLKRNGFYLQQKRNQQKYVHLKFRNCEFRYVHFCQKD